MTAITSVPFKPSRAFTKKLTEWIESSENGDRSTNDSIIYNNANLSALFNDIDWDVFWWESTPPEELIVTERRIYRNILKFEKLYIWAKLHG